MAWVNQKFELGGMFVSLEERQVKLGQSGCDLAYMRPANRDEAHGMALMLRKAARRMEEIGLGLPGPPPAPGSYRRG